MLKRIYYFFSIMLMFAGTAPALTLDEAIRLGKERSLMKESSRIDGDRVEGQITEAWSNALPQVDGMMAYQRAWKSPVMFFPNPETGEYTKITTQQANSAIGEATVTQPIYTFGRIGAALKAAYAARSSNQHLIAYTDKSLELEILKRYWSILLLKEVLNVRRESVAISDSTLQRIMRLRDVGMLSDYDVLRAQVQVSNQIPQLRQAENNLELSELALKEVLGVPLDTALTADGDLADYEIEAAGEPGDAWITRRDDLEALRDLNSVFENIYKINRSAKWPTIGGQVKYNWTWSNEILGLNPRNNASSVTGGISLIIPFWSSGRNHGRAQQARADWRKTQLDLANAERGANLQLMSAVSSYRAAQAYEEAARVAVTQAEQARRIAQTRLDQGQITPLELEASQLDELAAKVALAGSKYERLTAAAETRLAAGFSPYSK